MPVVIDWLFLALMNSVVELVWSPTTALVVVQKVRRHFKVSALI